MTTYRYDTDDRLIEAVTTQDPEWLPEDIEGIRLLNDYDAAHCPGCGQPLAESMDKKNRRKYSVTLHPCHACEQKNIHVKDWAEAGEMTEGLRVSVKPDWR